MTNRETILNELSELGSSLAMHRPHSVFDVPNGYFEELATQIMTRIKALEASTAKEELTILSSQLSKIRKENPFNVPEGYFENLSDNILLAIRMQTEILHQEDLRLSSQEEMKKLSPLLSSISRETLYKVPAGYFDHLPITAGNKEKPKVIALPRPKIYRFTAAAAIIGLLLTSGLLLIFQKPIDPNKNPAAWVEKNVEKKISPQLLEEFVSLAKADEDLKDLNENEPVKVEEIKELMKDVPENEIQEFLNETLALESNDTGDALLN